MLLLGDLTFFLGLQISQGDDGIFIFQAKYVKEMLNRFQMEDCKLVNIPMVKGCKLSIEDSSNDVDHRIYRPMIGNLLYVIASRSYVMQVVRQLALFQATPKESHVIVVKRIY